MIVSGLSSQRLASNVAKINDDYLCPVEIKKFPDGEKYIRIKGDIEKEVTVIQSTGFPQDESLIELLFIIKNLKDLGAEEITAVLPYMGYARQEQRFKSGECISAEIVANLIEFAGATSFKSINLHENCVRDFFNIPSENLSAMPAIAESFKEKYENPIIIAPDKGALSFAEEIAEILNCPYDYMNKVRLGPDKVETKVNKLDVDGMEAVIIDDIISTGGTIVNAIRILKENNAKSVTVSCVHPVLVNDAIIKIYSEGIKSLEATDTLVSEVSTISVAKTIADSL